ncbi:MAG: DUF2066 domain-containing protein [Kiloniellales bacterium]
MSILAKIASPLAVLATLLTLACGTAAAATLDALYQAGTIVTGQGEEGRALGFPVCLEHVLVKVSGDPRLAGDPRVAALAGEAGDYVSDFRYRDRLAGIQIHDEQGSRERSYELTVDFDPARIDAALRSLGREPWSAPRPRLALFLAVRIGTAYYALASDGARGRDQRDALAAESERFGLPLALPSEAALAGAGLGVERLPAADLAALDTVAKTIGADLALAGELTWSDEALGWIADWRLGAEGETHRWGIRGVSFDAAFRNALGGAAQILSGNGQPK